VAEIPGWLLALAVPISALLGVVITVVVTRRNATEAQRTAEHEERMRSLRWAAELAVSDVEAEARLGVLELERLGTNPAIDEHEQELIDAALEAAQYADKLAVANADPDAQVVFVDESETIEAADAKESE
jgi:ribosome assembly protein YihI (activator of Der GTPase)